MRSSGKVTMGGNISRPINFARPLVVAEAAAEVVVSFLVVFKAINIGRVLPATEVMPVDLITLSA